MQELNLQSIWQNSTHAADGFYTKIKPNITAIAQQRSKSILTSIHRNTLIELGSGFVLLLGMTTFLWDVPKGLLLIFVLYSLITLRVSFQFWNDFRLKASHVHRTNMKDSLRQYVYLLKNYKNHLWNYSVSLIPFTVIIGFIGGYCKGSNNNLNSIFESNILLVSALTIVLLMSLGYILLRWYFRTFLDTKINEIEIILTDLES